MFLRSFYLVILFLKFMYGLSLIVVQNAAKVIILIELAFFGEL